MTAPEPERDTGLAAMVTAAQPGDHGVVADWIEEHLGLDDLAAVLRQGIDDPRDAEEQTRTSCDGFRYRRLDRFVLLTVAHYRVWQPFVAGRKRKKEPAGHVVCLCTPPHGPAGMRRWGRWLPEETAEPAIGRLWEELGKDVPGGAEEQT